MKKKKIFVNKINKNIGNNQSNCEVKEDTVIVNNTETVEEKLERLFNTNGYIFNIKVKIKANDKTYDTKIASRVGDNLITLDNDIINVADIKDIIF
jgi:hypothetical protein